MNTGVSLAGFSFTTLLEPIPLGIAAGLLIGKQLGIFGACWLAIQLRIAKLPSGVGWWELYGVALLGGIGFTMSLFISSLAFEGSTVVTNDRLGILVGSILSALIGYSILKWRLSTQINA
jgi:NhaA family Na+:H+ antiporter